MIVAPDALNRLVAYRFKTRMSGEVNLLLGFTVSTFHPHNDIALVGHPSSI
jgi:hypothetical protein